MVHSSSPKDKQSLVPADGPAKCSGWSSHMQTTATAELDTGISCGPSSAAHEQLGPCCLPVEPLQNNSVFPRAFTTAASWDIPMVTIPMATEVTCRAPHLAHLLLAESPPLQPLRPGAASSAGIYHKCMDGPIQMSSDNWDTARHPMLCLQGASTAHLTDPGK